MENLVYGATYNSYNYKLMRIFHADQEGGFEIIPCCRFYTVDGKTKIHKKIDNFYVTTFREGHQ